jgi:hypothetical protein
VTRRFTPPDSRLSSTRGIDGDELMRLLYGFTTVEQRCETCGLTNFIKVSGNQTT